MPTTPLGLPLLGVQDACQACGRREWLVYVWYRRCAACHHRDDTTRTYVPAPQPRRGTTQRTRDDGYLRL